MAPCQVEARIYRQCLKDAGAIGINGSTGCMKLAIGLEKCRETWRNDHGILHEFDGRRILPHRRCQVFNKEFKRCLKWKENDQSKCQKPIQALKSCMDQEEGILAAPTEGDKVWSDYKDGHIVPHAGQRMVVSKDDSCDY